MSRDYPWKSTHNGGDMSPFFATAFSFQLGRYTILAGRRPAYIYILKHSTPFLFSRSGRTMKKADCPARTFVLFPIYVNKTFLSYSIWYIAFSSRFGCLSFIPPSPCYIYGIHENMRINADQFRSDGRPKELYRL